MCFCESHSSHRFESSIYESRHFPSFCSISLVAHNATGRRQPLPSCLLGIGHLPPLFGCISLDNLGYILVQRNRDSPRREFHSEELCSLFPSNHYIGSFQSSVFLQSLMDCPIEKNNVGRLSSSDAALLVATGISAFNPTTCLSSMTTCMIVFADMALVRRLSRMRASLVRHMLYCDD